MGIGLENSVLSMLGEFVMAQNAPKPAKTPYLLRASGHLEIARLKLRLFLELDLANGTKIFQAQGHLAEINRELGNWLNYLGNA